MARSCSGNLRLYDTIPPHGLPLLYLEGGTLGCGAYSRKKSLIQDRQSVSQTTASATQKGRHKQKMYQSQFLGSSIALESFSKTAKFRCPEPCSPSRDRGGQIGKCFCTSSFDSPTLFLVIIKLCATLAPSFIHG